MAVTLISGLIPLLAYFFVFPALTGISDAIVGLASRILNYSFVLAVLTMFITHARTAIKQESSESIYSAILVVSLVLTAGIGIAAGANHPAYNCIITHIRNPPEQAMMVTMLLFWVSSFYRVFRVKSLTTLLMTIAFLIVVINVAPPTAVWTPWMVTLRDFINTNVYTRIGIAVRVGAAIGSVILGIRLLLGRERGYLSE